jgi:UDP-N-acetylglucosamine--N-acetylmuramyl-(pentapeptide) pyrophosphoryl-undecaprenol N-acetylglucosamine transferase
MSIRVLFAAGGTGGHILPALSVADELRSMIPNLESLFVGTRSGLEATLVPQAGYAIEYIFAKGVRGKGVAGRVRSAASIGAGCVQAVKIITRFRPDVIFGAGGYASAAAVLAGALLRKTIVLQEQNSIPGLTNRLLARFAKRVYLGFERARAFFGSHRGLFVTGNPLRRDLADAVAGDPRAEFGLAKDRPVLLVFGGSQGARTLNHAAVEYLLGRAAVQAIIQTGESDFTWVSERIRALEGRVYAVPYIAAMHRAYGAADIALARAGALSVSELAAVGVPAILVPYPFAADDHQRSNAALLVDAGGAVLIADAELTAERLAHVLDPLFADPARLGAMRRCLEGIARRDAARAIARDVLRLAGGGAGAREERL